MYYNFFTLVKVVACLLLSLLALVLQAQVHGIDSLENIIKATRDQKEIAKLKIELADRYFDSDKNKALTLAQEGSLLATQFGDSAQMVRGRRLEGQLFRRLGRLDEAINRFESILGTAKRNNYKDDYKKALNSLALVHTLRAEYDKALEYNFQSLVIRESDGNKKEISIALNNIALVYFKLHNYDAALKYNLECLRLKTEISDTYDLDYLHLNLGLCYIQLRKYEEARISILKGLAVCGANCDDLAKIEGEFGLGESSYWLKDYGDASLHLNKSLALARATNDSRWRAENLVYLGLVSLKQRAYEKSVAQFTEADTIALRSGFNQISIDVYKHFSELYTETADYKKASEYQKKYIIISDSLIGRDLVKSIGQIEANYEQKENIATIASKEVVIKQARDLNVAITVIAMLAGLLVLVLQFGNRNIKRVNAKLSEAKETIQRQNSELENKNRELDIEVDKKTIDLARVNQSLKQVNDELDNFIYKTSHDIRGPLASLKGMCNVALLDVKDPIALDYLKKLDATAERLNSILTRLVIINQINNSKLTIDRIDFKSIINDVMLLEKKKGLPQDLRISTFIDPKAEIQSDKELVRIVLENLIDNAIKFYNDSERIESFMNVHITSLENGGVKCRVIDNGIGISESSPGKLFQMFSRASERSETGGIGLYITKTATEKIGGRVGLLTTPEGFTEFYVVFPSSPYPETQRLERRIG